jgi:hypothetical protein
MLILECVIVIFTDTGVRDQTSLETVVLVHIFSSLVSLTCSKQRVLANDLGLLRYLIFQVSHLKSVFIFLWSFQWMNPSTTPVLCNICNMLGSICAICPAPNSQTGRPPLVGYPPYLEVIFYDRNLNRAPWQLTHLKWRCSYFCWETVNSSRGSHTLLSLWKICQ